VRQATPEETAAMEKQLLKTRAAAANLSKPSRPDVNVFIAEYLRDPNGRRAAIAAGYTERSADSTASRLLKNAKVRQAIDKANAEVIAKVQQDTGITLERTLREIARISFFDPRKLFRKDGSPLDITELDDDTAAVIAGLEVLEEFEGTGRDRVKVGEIKKWKLSDKKGGLDVLMKHLGGYKVDNEQKKPELSEAIAAFVGGLHGTGVGRLPLAPQKARPAP
jgi:phage terminase small subunit